VASVCAGLGACKICGARACAPRRSDQNPVLVFQLVLGIAKILEPAESAQGRIAGIVPLWDSPRLPQEVKRTPTLKLPKEYMAFEPA
jgi:hypothetical protein